MAKQEGVSEHGSRDISRQEIYRRIKTLLSELGGVDTNEIVADLALHKDPLNYTSAAKLALASKIVEAFPEWPLNVGAQETASCLVVRDLRILIERRLREAGVEVAGTRIFGGLKP